MNPTFYVCLAERDVWSAPRRLPEARAELTFRPKRFKILPAAEQYARVERIGGVDAVIVVEMAS